MTREGAIVGPDEDVDKERRPPVLSGGRVAEEGEGSKEESQQSTEREKIENGKWKLVKSDTFGRVRVS
jgi:hypothetical protein